MLRVRLFGGGRLLDGDAEIKLPSRHFTLPLLAYVLLQRGAAIPRRRLAFVLWPDESEEGALQHLRRNLHVLGKALPATSSDSPWLWVDAESVAWNQASDYEFDVADFERLRADAATLERASALYAGDLLEDVYDDWVVAERERLRRLHQADAIALLTAARSRRDFAAAAAHARRLLDDDPFREDVVRQLMAVRYESGDAAGALAECDRFAQTLRAEMDAAPMPETLALREAIARGEAIAGAAPPAPARQLSAPAAPFVGRRRQLDALWDVWARVATGSGALAFVRGDAGIGKSRLVAELALRVEAAGGRVLLGTTSAPEREPLQCFSAALRGALPLLAALALPPRQLAVVADLVPELRAYRKGVPAGPVSERADERHALFEALAQTLSELGRPRPVLLVLEDVHLAGAATIDAVRAIVPRTARSPVLVVATFRPGDVARGHPLRGLERTFGGAFETIDLGPLAADEIAALVEALGAPQSVAAPAFVAALAVRSEGNPLFVTELLYDALHGGDERAPMPASVRAMVERRVAALSPGAREVAEIAAVAGEAFSLDVVRDVAGLPENELLAGLDELLDRRLVREASERRRFDYAFTHALVHAAIAAGVPEAAGARRHRRVARLLEESAPAGERALEIAAHYEAGGDGSSAAAHYALAARRAARLGANAEARESAGRALALDPSDDVRNVELLDLRARMSARLADAAAERDDVAALGERAARLGPEARCIALERGIDFAYRRGDHAAEREGIERLAREAAALGSERWLASAAEARARRFRNDGAYAEAIASALEARDRYARAADDAACVRATAFAAAVCAASPERGAEASALADEAVALAERTGDAEVRAFALRQASGVAQERQDSARYAALSEAALELCREVGDRNAEVTARGALGTAYWQLWRVDEALAQFRAAIALAESSGIARIAAVLANLGGLLGDLGDFSEALAWYRRAEEVALKHDALDSAATAAVAPADLAWQRGDLGALAAALERARTVVARLPGSRHEANLAKNEARLLRCRGEFDASLRELDRARALYERAGRWTNAAEIFDELALTYLASGAPSDARAALDAGASDDSARERRAPYPVRHQWIAACVARAGGDGPVASDALQRAGQILAERCAASSDATLRAAYESIPVHRAVRAALDGGNWPQAASPCVVAFPG